jgi:ankyrin repeat protein
MNIELDKLFKSSELVVAVHSGNMGEVTRVLEEGADVHVDDDQALKIVCSFGRLEIVKLLLENGADIKADDYDGLKMAKLFGQTEVVEYLNKWMLLDKLKELV